MPPSLNKAQIRKLGHRLRDPYPSRNDLDGLATLQDDYLSALEKVDYALREVLGLASGRLRDGVKLTLSNRLKRDRRIIEKLRRGTELDRMQDIVGFRIVGGFSLSQQDDLTNDVAAHFDGVVKDRRTEPSFGYRAVHVVADVDGFLVEVQIRTALQDIWAQHMEAISDAWGRDIQYGGQPEAFSDAIRAKKVEAVEQFKSMSNLMAAIEEHEDDVRRTDSELLLLEDSSQPGDIDRRHALVAHRSEAQADIDHYDAELHGSIDVYNTFLNDLKHLEQKE